MFVFSAVLFRNVHISKNQYAIVLDLGWIRRAGLYVRKMNALLFSACWDRKSFTNKQKINIQTIRTLMGNCFVVLTCKDKWSYSTIIKTLRIFYVPKPLEFLLKLLTSFIGGQWCPYIKSIVFFSLFPFFSIIL